VSLSFRSTLVSCILIAFCVAGRSEAIPSEKEATAILRAAYFDTDYEHAYRLGKSYVEAYPDADELKAWYVGGWANYRQRELAHDMVAYVDQFAKESPASPWSRVARTFALSNGPPGGGEFAWEIKASQEVWQIRRRLIAYIDSTEAAGLGEHPDFPWFKATRLNWGVRKEQAIEYAEQLIPTAADPVELLRAVGVAKFVISNRGKVADKASWRSKALAALKQAQLADPHRGGAFYEEGAYLVDIGCPPCRIEIPGLNKLVEDYKDNDVVFLALANDKPEALNKFLEKTRFTYQIIPSAREIATQYNVSGFPTYVVIGKDGKVTQSMVGGSPSRHLDLVPFIDKALEEG
jgi:thiol-disulfide isomerase/thioredoxin